MITAALEDPILERLRRVLDELYGDRIERVGLFGSHARGDANEESDYDIAVFLNNLTDRWRELDRLADLRSDFLEDADVKPYPAGAYRDRTTLMREIRREGIDPEIGGKAMNPLLQRISIDPAICGGKPCIKGTRIWVSSILDFLADGMSEGELLAGYPQLVHDDVLAAARVHFVPVTAA
jgi:uncharacterized protein (DUF433 family)/predicted nucleotidyltransferase